MWVLDPRPPGDIPPMGSGPNGVMVQRDTTYVPGFYKIFDEIMVNAADNKQRDPKMDTIKYVASMPTFLFITIFDQD